MRQVQSSVGACRQNWTWCLQNSDHHSHHGLVLVIVERRKGSAMKPLHVVLILSNVLWLVFVVSPYVSVLAPNSCDPRQTTPSPPASQDAPKDLAKDGPSYIEGASPGTSSTSSSSGPPSVERFRRDRDASWLDTPSFEHTRERVLKAHSIYRMKVVSLPGDLPPPPTSRRNRNHCSLQTPALACRGPQLGAPYQSGQWV